MEKRHMVLQSFVNVWTNFSTVQMSNFKEIKNDLQRIIKNKLYINKYKEGTNFPSEKGD